MNRRVLLATKNQALKEACKRFLEGSGYEVESAENALECYRKLSENPPDILLLDSGLHWGGSEGVLDCMRDDPELYAIPVVWITEERNPYALAQVVEDPVVAYLSKPFNLNTLLQNLLLADSHTYKAFLEQAV